MKIQLYILTCPKRKDTLADTLASIEASDWNEAPIVHQDTHGLDPAVSMIRAAHDLLTASTSRQWDYMLFCEDDIEVNRHLRHNLERWQPLVDGSCMVGRLYDGDWREGNGQHWCALNPVDIGGSQAVLIKRSWLPVILRKWDRMPGTWMQDIRIFRSLLDTPYKLIVHTPNLVQHRGTVSTWHGPPHTSPTYSPDFFTHITSQS